MNALEFEKIADNAEYINYQYSESGEVVLSVHFQSCFYFWNGHTAKIRDAILNCYDKYMQLWGSNITWGFNPLKGWQSKSFQQLPSLSEVFSKRGPEEVIEWYVADGGYRGHEIDSINTYVFSIITSESWQIQEGSLLTFRVPRGLYFDEQSKKQIQEFNDYCILQLNPWYALSGMQAATPFSDNNIKIDLVSQARDFKGIYIRESWDTIRMPYGVRSFDWLTYVSAALAEKVGGLEHLKKTLETSKLKFQKYPQGLLIQVTADPELIPSHTEDPANYIKLNHILRPLRDGNYGSMGDGIYLGDNLQSFDRKLTDLWIRRFDHPCAWNDLISTAESQKILSPFLVSTDQTCPISGRYRYEADYDDIRNHPRSYEDSDQRENDYRAYIILNKGDIMPYYLKLDQHGNLIKRMKVEWTLFEKFNY